MFIDPKSIPTEPLRNKLIHQCAYKSHELNFIFDNNYDIACFIEGSKPFTGLFFITDEDFHPKLIYRTEAYINSCAISRTGKYAICQTTRSESVEDSEKFIIIDVTTQSVIQKVYIVTGWKSLTHLFVDENSKTFFTYYEDLKVEYDFQGNAVKEEELFKVQLIIFDDYQLMSLANNLISHLSFLYSESPTNQMADILIAEQEKRLSQVLSRINRDTSPYQLSQVYRNLGDCYAENDFRGKAVQAYEQGLSLNPKLPVKKRLKELKE